MSSSFRFHNIGIIRKANAPNLSSTIQAVQAYLTKLGCQVRLDDECSRDTLVKGADLIIVVGGDGSMLDAARSVINHQKPVLGLNRGGLGFLTDISPTEFEDQILAVLNGNFTEEKRFLLEAHVTRAGKKVESSTALNDVVLYSGHIARMIEFETFIDNQFVFSLRSDGIIVSTPTGSTAYALSGGGPIVHPCLEAVILVPMHPHTLSSRPLVVHSHAEISLKISEKSELNPRLSCDGQTHFVLSAGDEIMIKRLDQTLTLIHPPGYDYYNVLRQKLNWGQPLLAR